VRALSELDADPLLALPEAAERIAAALGADLVGCAFCLGGGKGRTQAAHLLLLML
jgi:hypothetical protein